MRFRYYEETDSFFVSLGAGSYADTVTVAYDFFVDIDSKGRLSGIESIGASRHLAISDPIATPPEFKWVNLTDSDPLPIRSSKRERFFVYRPDQDTLHIEFAGGEPTGKVEVTNGVDAQLDNAGRVVGLDIASASRNLDLHEILSAGATEIEWVAHRATAPVAP